MDLFTVIANLYTNPKSNWIVDLNDSDIEPFIINRFLANNEALSAQAKWLDAYTFALPAKMWLSLAWSVIPKVKKAPFIKYPKKQIKADEFDFILSRVRHYFNMADNDFKMTRDRIVNYILKDMPAWFIFFGIEKIYWKRYGLNFELMKQQSVSKGLMDWGS
jgi:hypothetical protein